MINYNLMEKKRKLENNEISVKDLTDEEVKELNALYESLNQELEFKIKQQIEINKKKREQKNNN